MVNQPLSPAAQAVLTAITQQEYCLDPSDIPNEAARIGCLVAAALRALDSQLGHEILGVRGVDCSQIQLIAAELEGTDG